jgi:hypothetical protein
MTNDTSASSHSNHSTVTDHIRRSAILENALDRDFRRRIVRKMGHEPTNTMADASQRPRLNRSRWAAIGAAVAVSLGAGGFGLANATVSSGEQPVYIAISPCRLSDTRPAFPVNTRLTPYGPNETVTWTGTGAQGNCNVPAGVSALVLNVTALDATLPTYLQFAPGTTVTPGGASSLNPVPGEPPTPNAVTIPIDDAGKFSIYNLQGTVNVIIDVVGYYDDHEHTGADIIDGSLTGADVADGSIAGVDITDESIAGVDITDESVESVDIKNNTVTNGDTSNEPGIVYNADTADEALTDAEEVVLTTRIRPPSTGYVHVSASIDWFASAGDQIRCSLTDGTAVHTTAMFRDSADSSLAQTFSIEATFPVDQYVGLITSGRPFNLVCDMSTGQTGSIGNTIMSATFFASSYAPFDFIFPIFPFLEEGVSEEGDV